MVPSGDLRLNTPAHQVVNLACSLLVCRAGVEQARGKKYGALSTSFSALLNLPVNFEFGGGQQKRPWTVKMLLQKMKVCF